jgi:hypothetical protein
MPIAGSHRIFVSSQSAKKGGWLKTWSFGVCWKVDQLSTLRHRQSQVERRGHYFKSFSLSDLW